MMKIPVEDNFEDVLQKAAAGLGQSVESLAAGTDLTRSDVKALFAGNLNERHLRVLAGALRLNPNALLSMARGEWYPVVPDVEGLECYSTPFPVPGYEAMAVNSYLVWNRRTCEAIAFDTGSRADMMLADIRQHGLTLKALFLTHTHRDHVAAYDSLLEATEYPTSYAPEAEPFGTSNPVKHGDRWDIAGFNIEARLTCGHSPGGMTYVLDGLARPVALVGDSLFCMSQGGAPRAYAQALENNRKQILGLADDTVLCPGHGPLTTVAYEKTHNPFFANAPDETD